MSVFSILQACHLQNHGFYRLEHSLKLPELSRPILSILDEISQLRNIIQQFLQIHIRDLIVQTWYQGLCLLCSLAAETAYLTSFKRLQFRM